MKSTSWRLLIFGLWLFMAPSALWYTGIRAAVLNDRISGALIVALAAWELVARARPPSALDWLGVLAGLWVTIAPFSLGYLGWQGADHTIYVLGLSAVITAIANDVIFGLLVMGSSLTRARSRGVQTYA